MQGIGASGTGPADGLSMANTGSPRSAELSWPAGAASQLLSGFGSAAALLLHCTLEVANAMQTLLELPQASLLLGVVLIPFLIVFFRFLFLHNNQESSREFKGSSVSAEPYIHSKVPSRVLSTTNSTCPILNVVLWALPPPGLSRLLAKVATS